MRMLKFLTPFLRSFIAICLGELLLISCLIEAGQTAGEIPSKLRKTSRTQPGILDAEKFHGTLFGMDYEPWFTTKNVTWDTAEAVPLLGKYSSYDVNVIKKHAQWFEYLGINWILVDWSNMLWMKPSWEEQIEGVKQLEEATRLLFETYRQLEKEGEHPPKIVLLLGLQNGPPVRNGVERLRGIFKWIEMHFLSNPQYHDLWLYYDGKPLIVIWYSPYDACKRLPLLLKKHPLDEPQWTIRWMNQQLQITHAEDCGMWSWIDGIIQQKVIYRDGKPEETVVGPSCFPPAGWLDPAAVGRDHGVPYLESWKVAFAARPKFIQIRQWNEFAGEKVGHGYGAYHHVYLDEYSPSLSDDLEPTRLHACGYRGCGGWGYYYMNLTKALISLYRGETPHITVTALSSPPEKEVKTRSYLPLDWITVGVPPSSYSLAIDGETIAENIHANELTLDLTETAPGLHTVTLTANGVYTYFDLNPMKLAQRSVKPLPVTSTIKFKYAPSSSQKR